MERDSDLEGQQGACQQTGAGNERQVGRYYIHSRGGPPPAHMGIPVRLQVVGGGEGTIWGGVSIFTEEKKSRKTLQMPPPPPGVQRILG